MSESFKYPFNKILLSPLTLYKNITFKKILINYTLGALTVLVLSPAVFFQFLTISDISQATTSVECLATLSHTAVRKFMVLMKKKELISILHMCQKFNGYNDEHRKYFKLIFYYFQWNRMAVFFVVTLMCIFPLFNDERKTPLLRDIPSDNPVILWILYLAQVVLLYEVCAIVVEVDSTFIFLCYSMAIQFKFLCKSIETLNLRKDCTKEIVIIVIILIGVSRRLRRKVNEYYSPFFTMTYLVTIIALSTNLYAVITGDSFVGIKCMMTAIIILFNIAIIWIAGSYIAETAEMLPISIYNVNWHEAKNKKNVEMLIFMLMLSQKSLYMKGSGMFLVNRNEFLQVIKTGLSFFTFMKSMQ